MGRRHAKNPLRADPNLTPLLDVVLQLITFFMMLIHFGTRIEGETKAIRLPQAPAALPNAELSLDRLPVAVDREGRLIVEGTAKSGPAADRWWRDQAQLRREAQVRAGRSIASGLPTLVIVRADKELPYGRVRQLLLKAQEEGFSRFSLVVRRRIDR